MSFLSCTFDDGIFALKLDFSFFRSKRDEDEAEDEDDDVGQQATHLKPSKKKEKSKGEKPLPPPFALPPLKRIPTPLNLLLDAPALPTSLPSPAPPTLHLGPRSSAPRPSAPRPSRPSSPRPPRCSPPPQSSPNVIVDRSITQLGLGAPDRTLGMDDEDDSPLDGNKTDLVQQRRAVRKALRGAR